MNKKIPFFIVSLLLGISFLHTACMLDDNYYNDYDSSDSNIIQEPKSAEIPIPGTKEYFGCGSIDEYCSDSITFGYKESPFFDKEPIYQTTSDKERKFVKILEQEKLLTYYFGSPFKKEQKRKKKPFSRKKRKKRSLNRKKKKKVILKK